MQHTEHYTVAQVVRRLGARLVQRLGRARLPVLLLVGLAVVLLWVGPDGLTRLRPYVAFANGASGGSDDAADQYMRGLRDKDVAMMFGSLAPDLQHTIEQRYGRLGSAAVAALFSDQEQRREQVLGYKLIGRYETTQGESLRFYVVQAQRDGDSRDIPYTLFIDGEGKVSRVE